jgi:cell division protein FtsL
MLFGLVLAISLSLAALRIDILRLRYAMAEAVSVEKSLVDEHSALLARVASLRDPARLERLARERKMERPERVIELPKVQVASGALR